MKEEEEQFVANLDPISRLVYLHVWKRCCASKRRIQIGQYDYNYNYS